jgi:hypothetical protein
LFGRQLLLSIEGNLQICIANEANLWHIKVKIMRSDHVILIIAGFNFYIYATYLFQLGWVVQNACFQEGDDTLYIPPNLIYIKEKALKSPFKLR